MTPIEYYHQNLQEGAIVADEQQRTVLQHFQHIYHNLIHEQRARSKFLAALRKPKLVKGLYLWGGVGIGKTFLMDCFYHCIPFSQKMRMHFHQFMQMIHSELKSHQGEKNPLQMIAKKISQKTILLCFDEFHVTDIADAMILARLLNALFEQGVCLVATSNSAPDDLYKKGLQRKLFLPAIALLKENTLVTHIDTQHDYRLRHLKEAGVFYTPNDAVANVKMEKSFEFLANEKDIYHEPLIIHGRPILIQKRTEDVVWFDFADICSVPRSQHDYLYLAEHFKFIFISNIPIITADARNTITLFIKFIDVLYDAKIRLIASAQAPADQLYLSGSLLAEYKRTCSRLLEMQSEHYFGDNNAP